MIDYIAQIDDLYDINSVSMLEYAYGALDISDDVLSEGERFDKFKKKAGNIWSAIKAFFVNLWSKIKEFWKKHSVKNKILDLKLKNSIGKVKKAVSEADNETGNKMFGRIAKVTSSIINDEKGSDIKSSSPNRTFASIIVLNSDKMNKLIEGSEEYLDVLDNTYSVLSAASTRYDLKTSNIKTAKSNFTDFDYGFETNKTNESKRVTNIADVGNILDSDLKYTFNIYKRLDKLNGKVNTSYDKIIKKIEQIEKNTEVSGKAPTNLSGLRKAVTNKTQQFFKTVSEITKHKSYIRNYCDAVLKNSSEEAA